MTRKDTKHAVAAAQRVYAPSSMQNNQAGPPNTSGSGQAHVAQHSDRHHELYLPEDSRHRSSSATLAPRSKPAPAEIPRERNSQSSTLPTNLPLENKCKPSDLHSEDAQATVVESDSDDAEEAGELLSPETMPVFDPSDLFFMIMGVTGAGKSTFISLLTEENVEVGHALQSSQSSDYPSDHTISMLILLQIRNRLAFMSYDNQAESARGLLTPQASTTPSARILTCSKS